MVSVLATAVIDRRFEPQSSQMKKYKISICSFSAKHATVRAKTGRLGLLFQWASTKQIQLSGVFWKKAALIILSLNINLFSPWYSWQIAELALNNNHSLTLICVIYHTRIDKLTASILIHSCLSVFVCRWLAPLSTIFQLYRGGQFC